MSKRHTQVPAEMKQKHCPFRLLSCGSYELLATGWLVCKKHSSLMQTDSHFPCPCPLIIYIPLKLKTACKFHPDRVWSSILRDVASVSRRVNLKRRNMWFILCFETCHTALQPPLFRSKGVYQSRLNSGSRSRDRLHRSRSSRSHTQPVGSG